MKVLTGADRGDPSGHRRRLLEMDKKDLVEEVIKSWDALADSEAELSETQIKARRSEVEIAKIRGVRGVSTTKIEMKNRIEELEKEVSILLAKEDLEDEEIVRLREREEGLLTALLDLEREFAASKSE